VKRVLELVQLERHGDKYPRQLSGGQQQRVAFARAVVFEPRVLLMDEPLGALDRRLREALQAEIRALYERLGITLIYVTHDQEEALSMSDRIALFHDGYLEQVGAPSELYESPQSVFVANFLGDSTIFAGELLSTGAKVRVRCPVGEVRAPNPAGLGSGEAVKIMVRPERITVESAAAAHPAESSELNVVRGTITETTYFGSSERLTVELAPGTRATVARVAGAGVALRPGDRVVLSWEVDHGVLLRAGPEPASPAPGGSPTGAGIRAGAKTLAASG
jgi:putative spermidine/putrescine transport system ATP-binding protein